jgi:hypothetical protein
MQKSRRKIEKKRRKEAIKTKADRAYDAAYRAALKRASRYPVIVFESSEGDPSFVDLIKKTQEHIDLDDPMVCDDDTRALYRQIRDKGYTESVVQDSAFGTGGRKITDFLFHYGRVLYSRIPEEVRRQYLPFNDVNAFVRPNDNKQYLIFSSLLQTPGNGGTIYYSRKQPRVTLGGHDWQIGFSAHAIKQAALRLNPLYLEYDAAGDVHAYFAKCVYYEAAELDSPRRPKQPAFTLFDICDNTGFLAKEIFVGHVYGLNSATHDPSRGRFYCRFGYFPVVIDRMFAKATTFLRPGYIATPEYRLLKAATHLGRSKQAALLREATTTTRAGAVLEGLRESTKWLHDNGIPQVIQIPQRVYDTRLTVTRRATTVTHESVADKAMSHTTRKALRARLRRTPR